MEIYFDHAATSPMCDRAIEKITELMVTAYGNPSSSHAQGRKVKGIVELARRSIARNLNCEPSEICFTSGGTEADNMVLRCAVNMGIKHIITSPAEHKAILKTAENISNEGKAKIHYLEHDSDGYVDLESLRKLLLGKEKVLVSLMHANNEVGNMINLEEVGSLCHKMGALFHTDAVQTVGHFPINLSKGHVDFLSASAHKFNGPKGVGFIFMKKGSPICPLIIGGGQERNLRGGTENVIGIAGMAEALDYNLSNLEQHKLHISGLKKYFAEQLLEYFEDVKLLGDFNRPNNYKVLSVSFPKTNDSGLLLFNLDLRGIFCSAGSACSSGAAEPSHVLSAMGYDTSRPTIRFSFGVENTKEEIDYTLGELKILFPQQVRIHA